MAVLLTTCSTSGGTHPSGGSSHPASAPPLVTASPSADIAAPPLDCDGPADARAIWFRAADGTRLYGALLGSGQVGVVVANDVPHPLCETLTPARFLAARGYRVLVFDYRDRGLSDASDAPGRLDQDVVGAVAELRARGATRVILLGSYAGVAAAIVAATEIRPPVDGVIGISPAPSGASGSRVHSARSGPSRPLAISVCLPSTSRSGAIPTSPSETSAAYTA